MNLHKAILIGRLTESPEMRNTPSGQSVCNFSLATNRVWFDKASGQKKEETDFHNIVLWGKLAEIASQYLTKGALACIEGRIRTRSWEDANGVKKYRTEIIAEKLQMGPRTGGFSGAGASSSPSAQNPSQYKAEGPVENPPTEKIPIIEDDGDADINVEDIPF